MPRFESSISNELKALVRVIHTLIMRTTSKQRQTSRGEYKVQHNFINKQTYQLTDNEKYKWEQGCFENIAKDRFKKHVQFLKSVGAVHYIFDVIAY